MSRRRKRREDPGSVAALVVLVLLLAVLVPSVRGVVTWIAVIALAFGLSYVLFRLWRQRTSIPPVTTSTISGPTIAFPDESRWPRDVAEPRTTKSRGLDASHPSAKAPPAPTFPYRARPVFFNRSEGAFYSALSSAVSGRYVVFSKVRLLDVCSDLPPEELVAFNRIAQKHIDFLLCDPATFKLAAAIELDGSSHWRRDRGESDTFKDELFRTIGVPLIRFQVGRAFRAVEISERIEQGIAPSSR